MEATGRSFDQHPRRYREASQIKQSNPAEERVTPDAADDEMQLLLLQEKLNKTKRKIRDWLCFLG
jgi:hypothetical protein